MDSREKEADLGNLSSHEALLVHHYRRCTPDRQDVALYFLEELDKQSTVTLPKNVIRLRK